jgi:hypothetical protein
MGDGGCFLSMSRAVFTFDSYIRRVPAFLYGVLLTGILRMPGWIAEEKGGETEISVDGGRFGKFAAKPAPAGLWHWREMTQPTA